MVEDIHFSEPERMAFTEAWTGRAEVRIDGRLVPFLGKAEFAKTKIATGRTKDKLDLELLREGGLLDEPEET